LTQNFPKTLYKLNNTEKSSSLAVSDFIFQSFSSVMEDASTWVNRMRPSKRKLDKTGWSETKSEDSTEEMLETESDSGQSFQSLQTIVGDVGFNTQVLLKIDPEKDEETGGVSLHFTSLRPKTVLGNKQGHHVISHRLVLEFCSKVALNCRLVCIPAEMDKAFKSVISNITLLGTNYPNPPDIGDYPKCDEGASKRLEKDYGPDHKEAYEIGMRQKRVNMVVGYLSNMLTYYNTMSDVTHARSEGGGINQGKEHSSVVALNAISHFLSFKKPLTSDQETEFYEQAVEENGEFVDGMIRIFGKGIDDVRKYFSEDKASFFEAFNEMANNPKLVGDVIEGLFDFSKTEERRSEDELAKMSKRCIEMSLIAFPELQTLDKSGIAEGFLEKVSKNQGWDLKPERTQKLVKEVASTTKPETTPSVGR